MSNNESHRFVYSIHKLLNDFNVAKKRAIQQRQTPNASQFQSILLELRSLLEQASVYDINLQGTPNYKDGSLKVDDCATCKYSTVVSHALSLNSPNVMALFVRVPTLVFSSVKVFVRANNSPAMEFGNACDQILATTNEEANSDNPGQHPRALVRQVYCAARGVNTLLEHSTLFHITHNDEDKLERLFTLVVKREFADIFDACNLCLVSMLRAPKVLDPPSNSRVVSYPPHVYRNAALLAQNYFNDLLS